MHFHSASVVKNVGINGQVSLGKEYAGRQIQITKLEDGTLIIKSGHFVPDNETWLHTPENSSKINKSIAWSQKHRRSDNFDKIVQNLESKSE